MRFRMRLPILLLVLCGGFPPVSAGASGPEARLGEATEALAACTAAAERRSPVEAAEHAARAEAKLQAVLAGDPAQPDAHLVLAKTLLQCRIAEAPMMEKVELMMRIERHLGAVLETDPQRWEAHYLYGVLLYNVPPMLNRGDDAAEHLTRTVALQEAGGGPQLAEPYLLLGDLHRRLGREDEAQSIWTRGRALYPGETAFDERLGEANQSEPPGGPERPGGTDPPGSPRAALRERLRREAQRGEIPGVVAGLSVDGRRVLLEGFGLADVENEVAMTEDSVVRIGSVTKQFTAVVLLRLAEEGLLRLDDPAKRWLPAGDGEALEGIDLRQLLTHTAGLPRDPVDGAGWIPASLALPRVGRPEERYAYSNLGYALLGRVIERAGEASFAELLERFVLAPAGMPATGVCDERSIVPHRAQGYGWLGDRLVNDDAVSWDAALLYAGGLCSSARDLLRWQEALHGGRLLGREAYAELITVPRVSDPAGTSYAAGLRIDSRDGGAVIHHAGGISGFLSELAYHPPAKLAVVVVVNSEAADPRSLAFELAGLISAVPPPDRAVR